jgi:hypothetical protein
MLCFIANSGRTPGTALTQALKTYQNTVQLLLDSESYPGLSRKELETFKTTYRTEAYTCRYSRCPRAFNGFKSDQLRCQHENDVHRQSLKCTVPECKFGLSFASNRALKSHIQKYHSLPSTKNYPQSIRRLPPPSQGPLTLHSRHTSVERIMTDISSFNTHVDPQLSSVHPFGWSSPSAFSNGSPALDGTIDEEESSTIKCICGFPDDDGNIVLCETCDTWQHIVCYYESPEHILEIHECVDCSPRLVDLKRAAEQQRRLRELHNIGERKVKPKTATKGHKKKVKDAPGAV